MIGCVKMWNGRIKVDNATKLGSVYMVTGKHYVKERIGHKKVEVQKPILTPTTYYAHSCYCDAIVIHDLFTLDTLLIGGYDG
jgi:hypothetical protein